MSDWFQHTSLPSPFLDIQPFSRDHAVLWEEWADWPDFEFFPLMPSALDIGALWEFCQMRSALGVHLVAALEPETGRLAAISSYMDVRPAHKALEIGHTIIAPQQRGGWVNPALKLAQLSHAFETLGAVRVQLKSDERNLRSRAAMLKLGAKFEGVQRANMILPDGSLRNTSFYSIIASEWPGVKESLQDRLRQVLNISDS